MLARLHHASRITHHVARSRGRATRGVWLGLLALFISIASQALLFREEYHLLSGVLLAGAVLLGALAWGGRLQTQDDRRPATDDGLRESHQAHPHPPSIVHPSQPEVGGSFVRPSQARNPSSVAYRRSSVVLPLRLTGIAGSLLLALGSILAWLADPGAVFGLQGVLWVASMSLLVASCARWYPSTSAEDHTDPTWTRAEVTAFLGLLALALLTYLVRLEDIPWRFHYDEIIAHNEAMRFYRGPRISLFTTTWMGTSLPSLWFAVSAGFMRILGTELAGVRFGVALIGALTVIPVYGIARLLAGRTAALLAGFAWATSPVVVHYSRVSIINMTTSFCWAVCFYFLLRGLRSRHPGDFVWAGLAGGLSMYTYYGTRLLPYVLLAYLAYLAIFHFREFRHRLGHFALLAAGFFVGFGPFIAYFVSHPEMWAGRGIDQLNVPAALPASWEALVQYWNTLAPIMWRNVLGMSVLHSNDHVYWAPLLLPLEAALLFVGLGVLVRRWREPGVFLVLLWGLSVMFVGGTLITDVFVPALNHWTPAFPVFFLALALPPTLWLSSLRKTYPAFWPAGRVLVGLGMAALAVTNAYTYLIAYPARVPPSFETAQSRFMAALGPDAPLRFVGYSWPGYLPDMAQMMAPHVRGSHLFNPSRSLPIPEDPGDHSLVFVFGSDETRYLPIVQSYYPGGQAAPLAGPSSPWYTYSVPPAQVRSRYGVWLSLGASGSEDGARVAWQGQVPRVGALPDGVALTYPLTATWSGAFFVPEAQPLRLTLEGAPGTIWVQGEQVDFGEPLRLDRGWVPFSVRVPLSGAESVRMLAQTAGGPPGEFATPHLWPQPPGQGLAATLDGTAVTHRIDPFVGSRVWSPDRPTMGDLVPPPSERDPNLVPLGAPARGARRIRWEGEVYTEGGRYRMELRTDAHATLVIDDKEVLHLCNTPRPWDVPPPEGDPGVGATVELAAGWHRVRLDLDATGNANGLEWSWVRPDGVHEIVPPSRLRYNTGGAPGEVLAWPDVPGHIACGP